MLVSGKEILEVANKFGFAVPAFNAGSGQLLEAVMQACEETESPVMIAIHPDELSFLTDSFVDQVKYYANHSKVPVCIHLDHGASYEQVIHAIQLGFTSVMIDASHKSYEDNIAITKKVVEAAHAVGVSVEAELGTIGDTGNSIEGGVTEVIYTDPEVAQDFIEKTNVDSLKIMIQIFKELELITFVNNTIILNPNYKTVDLKKSPSFVKMESIFEMENLLLKESIVNIDKLFSKK